MKLVVNDKEYDPRAQPFIGDLRLLKQSFGFGWGTVAKRLQGLNDEADMLEILDDEDTLEALVAWIWMARLRGGERDVTRADVEQTPIDSITFMSEPGDVAPEADAAPTSAPTDSVRGDDKPAAKLPKKRSTKTSTKPSTPA